jgi:hypothetical protein
MLHLITFDQLIPYLIIAHRLCTALEEGADLGPHQGRFERLVGPLLRGCVRQGDAGHEL